MRIKACLRIAAILLVTVAVMAACHAREPRHVRAEELLKAMHDDLFLAHGVIDSLIVERDGVDLLAERLGKNPAAAGRLLDAMIKKGALNPVIAERCQVLKAAPPTAAQSGSATSTRRARARDKAQMKPLFDQHDRAGATLTPVADATILHGLLLYHDGAHTRVRLLEKSSSPELEALAQQLTRSYDDDVRLVHTQ